MKKSIERDTSIAANDRNAAESNSNNGALPQPNDIVLGRGKGYGKNPGNMAFQGELNPTTLSIDICTLHRASFTNHYYCFCTGMHIPELIRSNRLTYFESSFAEKRSIIEKIMCEIQDKGGRFVRMKNNAWSIIPTKACRLKIAHAIQYHIRNEFAQRKQEVLLISSGDKMVESCTNEPSERDHVGQDVQAKISWHDVQPAPSETPEEGTTCNTTGNVSYHELDFLTERDDRLHFEKDSSSTTDASCNASPCQDRKVAPSTEDLTERERIVKDIQAKLSWLGMPPAASELQEGTTSYHPTDLRTGADVRPQLEKHTPSSDGTGNVASPNIERKTKPSLEQFSERELVVKDIYAKLSWLGMQQPEPHELPARTTRQGNGNVSYHPFDLRTEVTGRSDTPSTIDIHRDDATPCFDCRVALPADHRSEREQIVKDIQAKLSWLGILSTSSDLPVGAMHHCTRNVSYQPLDLLNGGAASPYLEKDIPSKIDVPCNVVSPCLDRRVAQSSHTNIGHSCHNLNKHCLSETSCDTSNRCSVWKSGLDQYDPWGHPQQMYPFTQPNFETGVRLSQPLQHPAVPIGNPDVIHRSTSLPDRFSNRHPNGFSTPSTMSTRANSFYHENLNSLECVLDSAGACQRCKCGTCSGEFPANVANTFTNANPPVPYAPYDYQGTGKSERELGLFDNTRGSGFSMLESDFGFFDSDATREFNTPATGNDTDFEDDIICTRV